MDVVERLGGGPISTWITTGWRIYSLVPVKPTFPAAAATFAATKADDEQQLVLAVRLAVDRACGAPELEARLVRTQGALELSRNRPARGSNTSSAS